MLVFGTPLQFVEYRLGIWKDRLADAANYESPETRAREELICEAAIAALEEILVPEYTTTDQVDCDLVLP